MSERLRRKILSHQTKSAYEVLTKSTDETNKMLAIYCKKKVMMQSNREKSSVIRKSSATTTLAKSSFMTILIDYALTSH